MWLDKNSLRRLLSRVRRALRLERRLSLAETYQLFQLAETILDHGRMLQSYFEFSMDYAVVEVPELVFRLRETPATVTEALRLLRYMGRAERFDLRGRWRLRLADDATPLRKGRSAGG